ncbi:Aste57867_20793 [Aphanomyces stellatus]|uniref:Aste57867_20793 protein n=1 Tax=Aphanomyces stellatus TaxID=120398 RepID=A0A485LHW2_9STRA|nr:hypothetical protein As57867_020725 [Aphanomyces stellatus]VFT97472.1 Aste57867_20793 [Aphanomyces stellatus]
MAQQALVWDMGLVVAAVNGVDQWLQVYVRTAGSTMADIALSFAADFPTTTTQSALPCIGPQGIYLRQNQTDYAALAKVTKCAVDFTASVQGANSAMLSQDALLPTDVPAPRLWSHQDPGTSKNRNMAIHVTPGGGLEPVPWGQCPKAPTQTMGITIPCEQTTTGAFLPRPTYQMGQWLAAIAAKASASKAIVVTVAVDNSTSAFVPATTTTTWTSQPPTQVKNTTNSKVEIITASAGALVVVLVVVAFLVCTRRRQRAGHFVQVGTPIAVRPRVVPPTRSQQNNTTLPSLCSPAAWSDASASHTNVPSSDGAHSADGLHFGGSCLPPTCALHVRLNTLPLSSAYALAQLKQTPRLEFDGIKCNDVVASTTTTIVYYGQYYAREVAIKTFRAGARPTQDAVNQFADEIRLMSTFNHPNIVKLVGFACLSNVTTLAAITEYLPQDNLEAFLHAHPGLGWSEKAPLALDIAQALRYLHVLLDPAVIHRDLKTQNVFLDWPHAKLSGFGVSRQARDDETLTAGIGSAFYMAPEVLRSDGRYSVQADMYSFGCILVELDTQQPLYFELAQQPIIVMQRILMEGVTPALSPTCPVIIGDLALQCLHPDPHERPTAMDAFRAIELFMNPRDIEGRLM